MESKPLEKSRPHRLAWMALLVFVIGFSLRWYAGQSTYVINPDGALYIHQARAIFFGQLDKITPCGTGFLSNYAVLIAGAYVIFHDWILAAQAVSILFGSLTLIPVYLLSRRFFEPYISAGVMLIFAVIPVFVSRSADVVRGPVYWFFMAFGLYVFICHTGKRGYLFLLIANLSFLMAAWARIEAILLLMLTAGYLLIFQRENRIKKVLIFLLPTILIAIFYVGVMSRFDLPATTLLRSNEIMLNEIMLKATQPIRQYQKLRENLAFLAGSHHDELTELFLPEARNLVWLVAIGTLLNRAMEAFFYPLLLIFIVGFFGLGKKVRNDPRLIYFLLLAGGGCILLLAHILQYWMIYYRFMAIIIYPCAVFYGFGLEQIVRYFTSRFHLKAAVAYSMIAVLILVVTLPKNLAPRRDDKQVFKQIGEYVASKEGNSKEISVLASMASIRWFSFYANLNYQGAACPQPYDNYSMIVGNNYPNFIQRLKQRQIKYFLWEEKHWPTKRFNLFKKPYHRHFKKIGRWYHTDTGKMILFEVIS